MKWFYKYNLFLSNNYHNKCSCIRIGFDITSKGLNHHFKRGETNRNVRGNNVTEWREIDDKFHTRGSRGCINKQGNSAGPIDARLCSSQLSAALARQTRQPCNELVRWIRLTIGVSLELLSFSLWDNKTFGFLCHDAFNARRLCFSLAVTKRRKTFPAGKS